MYPALTCAWTTSSALSAAQRMRTAAARRAYSPRAATNQRLRKIAEQGHVWQQQQLTKNQTDLKQRLQNASGQQFDQEYMAAMVADHEKRFCAYAFSFGGGNAPGTTAAGSGSSAAPLPPRARH